MSAELGDSLAELLVDRPIFAARWGLERIEALLEELGRPERSYVTVHIAGTNGKGSTATFAASLLRAAGRATGLYTSPHLADVRERFQVDGRWVSDEILEAAARRILSCRSVADCTYFEATTALAFLSFAEAGVDVAVAETGLGGRLDATTVLQPSATAITPIGLEHVDLLGSSIEEIAAEKAGIVKPGVPVCLGRLDPRALDVIVRRARAVNAPTAVLGREATVSGVDVGWDGTRFHYRSRERPDGLWLATALPGAHQADNAALAILMLERSGLDAEDARVREGIESARLPGRFETWRDGARSWVFDIAHNPPAIERLVETLGLVGAPRPVTTVVGVLGDKDWGPMLDSLALDTEAIILTPVDSAPAARRWDLAQARGRLARFPGLRVEVAESVEEALELGRELSGSGTVLVTGSAYTVGDARGFSGIAVDSG